MRTSPSLLLSAVLVAAAAPSANAAESGILEFIHCLGGTPQSIKHGEGNAAHLVMMNGNVRSTVPGGMLDNTGSQCAVLNGSSNGVSFAHGLCEITDLDGDRLWFEFERRNNDGTFRGVSGTGKYVSLKLEGTYTHTRFPQRPGYFQGCAHSKGQWQKS